MGKLLSIKDYLLITAAFAGDFLEVTRSGWGVMPSAMKNIYGYVPPKWKYSSYLSSVSRRLSTGDINKVVDNNGSVHLELTPGGKEKFKRRFPLFMQNKKWDGYFMVAVFDIPEKERTNRDNLRRKLKSLGFGMLQKSVWISPYHFEDDMNEFLDNMDLKDKVFMLTAKKLLLGDIKKFAGKVWKLEKINKEYARVFDTFYKRKPSIDKEGSKLKLSSKKAKQVYDLYLSALLKDPLLPKEFLPGDWLRDRALSLVNQI